MKLIKTIETVIISSSQYELVKIDKQYTIGNSVRIEIRDKDGIYTRGFSGVSLNEVLEVFKEQYEER